jgi:hypothetical protein
MRGALVRGNWYMLVALVIVLLFLAYEFLGRDDGPPAVTTTPPATTAPGTAR